MAKKLMLDRDIINADHSQLVDDPKCYQLSAMVTETSVDHFIGKKLNRLIANHMVDSENW